MKFRWFHIIGSKKFAKMIASVKSNAVAEERRKTNRQMADLLHENAFLKVALGKTVKKRRA